MPIHILPPEVAAKIAAGEVVERPASVVKELVENSLDAGARTITVETRQGGRELVRVTDDGCGIHPDEVELAFARHATSKLATADDLAAIATLGFRGEALPSIAAVARLVMVTRPPQAAAGAMVEMRNGKVVSRRAQGASSGTSVAVHDLFGNVPARRKFLKSPAAETARIHALLSQFVLAYPHVHFTWLSDGRPALSAPGNGSLQEALAVVYGAQVASQLLPVNGTNADKSYHVTGMISTPAINRPNRGAIHLFVNGRVIQSRLLTYAVGEAYRGFITEGRHPLAVLDIRLPLSEVDVNVHPSKSEVRFLKEGEVFSAVQRAVREALVAHSPVPQVKLSTPASLNQQVSRPFAFSPPQPKEGEAASLASSPEPPTQTEGNSRMPPLRVLGQAAASYIIAEGPDGVYLIDQHAAHECVLVERVLREMEERRPQVQGLLEPLVVELGPGVAQLAVERRHLLEEYGFQLEPFGEAACLVRAVPTVARPNATVAGLGQLLAEMVELVASDRPPKEKERALAASIACHSAVRAGMVMEMPAMVALVRELEQAQNPRTCPHGRPTMVHLSSSHLEKEFHRR